MPYGTNTGTQHDFETDVAYLRHEKVSFSDAILLTTYV